MNTARREADLGLEERDWGLARETNKRKKVVLEGKDPEQEEKRKRKLKKKQRKAMRRADKSDLAKKLVKSKMSTATVKS